MFIWYNWDTINSWATWKCWTHFVRQSFPFKVWMMNVEQLNSIDWMVEAPIFPTIIMAKIWFERLNNNEAINIKKSTKPSMPKVIDKRVIKNDANNKSTSMIGIRAIGSFVLAFYIALCFGWIVARFRETAYMSTVYCEDFLYAHLICVYVLAVRSMQQQKSDAPHPLWMVVIIETCCASQWKLTNAGYPWFQYKIVYELFPTSKLWFWLLIAQFHIRFNQRLETFAATIFIRLSSSIFYWFNLIQASSFECQEWLTYNLRWNSWAIFNGSSHFLNDFLEFCGCRCWPQTSNKLKRYFWANKIRK